MGQHFDWRYEVRSIERGMSKDLQQQVGQTVPWYVFDTTDTVVDSIYDVSSSNTLGRRWYPPRFLEVMSAVKLEGEETTNDRGFYVVDTLHLVFSVQAARNAGLGDLVFKPDSHDIDRVVYESKVFEVSQVKVRGMVIADYVVLGVDLTQVKHEELVNDRDFQNYIPTDNG